MLKYILFYNCILNVIGFELMFTDCNSDGWKCRNSTDGTIDIVFSCKKDFEVNNPEVIWSYRRLPSMTQSVTFENCDISLTLDTNIENIGVHKRNLSAKNLKRLTNFLRHLKTITIRNITKLIFTEKFGDFISRLRGNATFAVENVKLIDKLPKELIRSPSPYIQKMKMESLNFTMRNVNIEWVVYHSVYWYKARIPLLMIWEKVVVNDTDVGIVEVVSTAENSPFLNFVEPEDNQVYIYNCRFNTISDLMFTLNTSIFHFVENKVDLLESHGFDVDSIYTNISGNVFRNVENSGFGYITLGYSPKTFYFENNTFHESDKKSLLFEDYAYDSDPKERASFRGNKLKCKRSAWLQRSKEESREDLDLIEEDYKTLLTIENMFYKNNENICIDLECLIPVSKYRQIYLKNETIPDYCS